MSHQTRRGSPLECPLASLGRNIKVALNGHHGPQYHYPLSCSPLNSQVYHVSRKSPELSIDTDDIVYVSSEIQQNNFDGSVGGNNKLHHHLRSDMYHLSRSSSSPTDLHQQHQCSQHYHDKTACELRYVHNLQSPPTATSSISTIPATVARQIPMQLVQKNYMPIDSILHFGHQQDRTPNNYAFRNSCRDSSDSGGRGNTGNSNKVCGSIHSVSNVSSSEEVKETELQYFLGKKMDSLYIQGAIQGVIRSLPIDLETNHFQNERYYLEESLRNLCDYNESNHIRQSHLNQRPSSPSETSGSDRYRFDRTSDSPEIATFISSGYSQSNTGQPEKRFHPKKVKSLSDGLSNLGRFSPSLDQGYATLVSPSPTGVYHQLTAAAAVENVLGLPSHPSQRLPWKKKGCCRSGPVFDRLSDDAVIKIFKWLDSCELCNVARVCRRFEYLAWQPILWKMINLKNEFINGDKALKMIFRQLCGQTQNGSCPSVERVMLSENCRITDKGMLLLTRRCPELTHLQLQGCVNVSNQALCDVLTKCTNLQHLDVTGCVQITNISLNQNLEPQRRLLLQYLDLTDCITIDDAGLKIVVKNCPQLVYLYVRRCNQITDAGLKFVPSFCITLKELSVSDCVNITDFGLYELAKLGAALRYLSVAKCDRVSDAGLKVIARRCYKLRYLNARGCEAVSDDSITVLARSCSRLRALDIGKCDVSDAGLRALAESCPNLKKLSLRNCDMITDRGVQCIAYFCRGLQQLNIQDCQISIEGYRAVKKYCKRCIIEHTNPGFC